jgi:uncharacterized protein
MSLVSFPQDQDISYLFLDWGELGALAYELSAQILSKNTQPYNRLIALATGGHTMSKALKDYLNIGKISSMQISFYTQIGQKAKTPVITQSIATDIQNERVLVFDDINDSGHTLEVAIDYLKLRGVKSVETATLLQKPHTQHPSTYFGQETKSWIIFPDEVRETVSDLTARWQEQGHTNSEIHARLTQIGLSEAHIALVELHS